jgi:hypothetical protein
VIASGNEIKNTASAAKNKPQPKANAAFKVIAFEAANAETGMQVRCSEAVTNPVDYSRNLTPP